MDRYKVEHITDVLNGRHNDTPNQTASMHKNNDGSYTVMYEDKNGFLREEHLSAEEYSAYNHISAERDKINQEQRLKDEARQQQADFKARTEQHRIEDETTTKEAAQLLKQLNSDFTYYRTVHADEYAMKLLQDYNDFNSKLFDIHDMSIRHELEKRIPFATFMHSSGSISQLNREFIKRLEDRIKEDPERYKKANLRRAKKEAKRRFKQLSPLNKFVATIKTKKVLEGNNATAIDNLYVAEGDSNGKSR